MNQNLQELADHACNRAQRKRADQNRQFTEIKLIKRRRKKQRQFDDHQNA